MAQILFFLFYIYDYYTISIANLRVTGSNHYGIAGWYTRTALEHGLLVSLSLHSLLCPSFFFVSRNNAVLFFSGNVIHQHVSPYGPYQSQGGRWKLLAFQSFVHSFVRFQFCNKSNYAKPLMGNVKRPRKKFSLAVGHVNIMFLFIHQFVRCQPKGFCLLPCFPLLPHSSFYSFSNSLLFRGQVDKLHVVFRIGV